MQLMLSENGTRDQQERVPVSQASNLPGSYCPLFQADFQKWDPLETSKSQPGDRKSFTECEYGVMSLDPSLVTRDRGFDGAVPWCCATGDYFTVSAPALHATPSWSPVAPLQPIAPMSFPPSMSGKPPWEATSVGSSVDI